MDSRGIEPRTTPMLREYYTTKPQARVIPHATSRLIGSWLVRDDAQFFSIYKACLVGQYIK